MSRLVFIFMTASFLMSSTSAKSKYTDETRPYEFGFNIEGNQHRHESKGDINLLIYSIVLALCIFIPVFYRFSDENGIIMGEFGFITADGVYHVTVYATDENGNFKILSMKNIKLGASNYIWTFPELFLYWYVFSKKICNDNPSKWKILGKSNFINQYLSTSFDWFGKNQYTNILQSYSFIDICPKIFSITHSSFFFSKTKSHQNTHWSVIICRNSYRINIAENGLTWNQIFNMSLMNWNDKQTYHFIRILSRTIFFLNIVIRWFWVSFHNGLWLFQCQM